MTALLDPLSLAFLDWCEQESVPASTIRRRAATLRSVESAGTATREQVETWWTSRADRSPSTRATDLACLRSFYRWAAVWEHRADDPTRRLKGPKVSKGLPRPVTATQAGQLLAAHRDTSPVVHRAIALGAYAGLRISEAATLTWAGVDLVHGHVTITGKGGKTRRVPLVDELATALGTPGAHEHSVVTGSSETYTADALQQRVNRAIRRAGVAATFHQLRHWFGCAAYQETQDLVAVGKLMGHASLNTTANYAAAADTMAGRIARAVARALDTHAAEQWHGGGATS